MRPRREAAENVGASKRKRNTSRASMRPRREAAENMEKDISFSERKDRFNEAAA